MRKISHLKKELRPPLSLAASLSGSQMHKLLTWLPRLHPEMSFIHRGPHTLVLSLHPPPRYPWRCLHMAQRLRRWVLVLVLLMLILGPQVWKVKDDRKVFDVPPLRDGVQLLST